MYEALIARLRAHAGNIDQEYACELGNGEMEAARDLRAAADALERFQKMQPEAYLCHGQATRTTQPCLSCRPLYRFPIGEDK
jgi:hypothetical protein